MNAFRPGQSFALTPAAHRELVARSLERCRRGLTAREREMLVDARRREIEAQQQLYAAWLNWLVGTPKAIRR